MRVSHCTVFVMLLFSMFALAEPVLLKNGGFELELTDWIQCSGTGGKSSVVKDTSSGSNVLRMDGGHCLYQEFKVTVDSTYLLECDAKSDVYTSLSLTIMDDQYQDLSRQKVEVNDIDFQSYIVSAEASIDAAIGAVTLYSEGDAMIDSCQVTAGITESGEKVDDGLLELADSLLTNGGFELNQSKWINCSGSKGETELVSDAINGEKAMSIDKGGCLYQEFPISEGVPYTLQCHSKSDGFTSMVLTLMNRDYTKLEANTVEVKGGEYEKYSANLVAPSESTIGVVTLYSEGKGKFDNCFVIGR